MTKLLNWLMFGRSSQDIHGTLPNYDFEDSFFIITRNSFQGYTTQKAFQHLSNLTSLISNCNIYALSSEEERDPEQAEVIKVAKFYEMVHDKTVIGMPVRAITEKDYKYSKEFEIVETWPLIQAYGLDCKFQMILIKLISSGRKWLLYHEAQILVLETVALKNLHGI